MRINHEGTENTERKSFCRVRETHQVFNRFTKFVSYCFSSDSSPPPPSLRGYLYLIPSLSAIALIFALSISRSAAEDKKPEDKQPKLLVAAPLGIVPGAATKLTLRGLRIDEAAEVQATIGDKQIETKLLSKQKSNLGQNPDPKLGGDSHVDIELTLSADAVGAIKFIAVTPAGASQAYELPVIAANDLQLEKEPNDGFDAPGKTQSQPIAIGKTILGCIERGQDVDVYSLESTPGQKLSFEITSRRLGSPLDAALTLFDGRGNLLTAGDDVSDSFDGRIECTSPGGKLYIVVSDANDQGSSAHGYRLTVR
jgi:hypothetical protein